MNALGRAGGALEFLFERLEGRPGVWLLRPAALRKAGDGGGLLYRKEWRTLPPVVNKRRQLRQRLPLPRQVAGRELPADDTEGVQGLLPGSPWPCSIYWAIY